MTFTKFSSFLLAIVISLSLMVGCTDGKLHYVHSNSGSDEASSQMPQTEPSLNNLDINSASSQLPQTEVYSSVSSIEDTSNDITSNDVSSQIKQNESSENKQMTENNCRLIVKGNDITDSTYVRLVDNPNYVPNQNPPYRPALPVVALMKALGARVQWNSTTTAAITYNGEKYLLDIANGSLVRKSEELLRGAPGSKVIYQNQILDHELIVDQSRLLRFFQLNSLKIRVDSENKIINIY